MPPKMKISKEDIVKIAADVVRQSGADAINARLLAEKLGCSTQPIFSNFESMDSLRRAVLEYADGLYNSYIESELKAQKYPSYKATGMAYIRFAKEEKELFKLLFMRDRTGEDSVLSISKSLSDIVESATGLEKPRAELFHLEMWVFVHGIATMIATGFFELDESLISDVLSDAYQGLKKRYDTKE